MTSEQNEQQPEFPAIGAEAAKVGNQSLESRVAALESRLAQMEAAGEGREKFVRFLDLLNEYVVDLKNELRSVRFIRFVTVVFALSFAALLAAVMICVVFFERQSFFWFNSNAFPVLIIGTVSGTVLLYISLLKGSFRTISDRHKDDLMPEHVKEVRDAVGPLFDSSSGG